MARTASRRARPIIPPAIPPATAAVFDFGAGLPALVAAGRLISEVEGTECSVIDEVVGAEVSIVDHEVA